MCVAVIATTEATIRSIALHVQRLRKKVKVSRGNELKATLADDEERIRLLRSLATEDIAIVAVILDKSHVVQEPKDKEEWYRRAVSLSLSQCVDRWPDLRITLDKRYTSKRLRDRLEQEVRESLAVLAGGEIRIEHQDSQNTPMLQAVDYVAWAIRRKYENQDTKCYDVISGKIIVEEIIQVT